MQTQSITRRLTYEDLLALPDDGLRHELIGGEHFVTPSPIMRHQRVSFRLSGAFFDYFKDHPVGEAFAAPLDIVLSKHDVVEPDLFVVLADQTEILTQKYVQGAPAIVIEILSPGTRRRDEGIKRRLYERTGVREYWLIDVDDNVVIVWSRAIDGKLVQTAVVGHTPGAILTSPLLPGFVLSLDELFG